MLQKTNSVSQSAPSPVEELLKTIRDPAAFEEALAKLHDAETKSKAAAEEAEKKLAELAGATKAHDAREEAIAKDRRTLGQEQAQLVQRRADLEAELAEARQALDARGRALDERQERIADEERRHRENSDKLAVLLTAWLRPAA